MLNRDMTNKADSHQFRYHITRDGVLFVYWSEKLVRTYRGKVASALIMKLNKSKSDAEQQMILAKATGNFKRGNER